MSDRQQKLSDALEELYSRCDDILRTEGIDGVPDEIIQRLNTLGVKLFATAFDSGRDLTPVLNTDAVSATDASVFTSAILKVVNMDLFELSLWRQWGTSGSEQEQDPSEPVSAEASA